MNFSLSNDFSVLWRRPRKEIIIDGKSMITIDEREKRLKRKIKQFMEEKRRFQQEEEIVINRRKELSDRLLQIYEMPTYLFHLTDMLKKRQLKAVDILSEPINSYEELEELVGKQENALQLLEEKLNSSSYDISHLEEKVTNENLELDKTLSEILVKHNGNEGIKLSISRMLKEEKQETPDILNNNNIPVTSSSELKNEDGITPLNNERVLQIHNDILKKQDDIVQIDQKTHHIEKSFEDHQNAVMASYHEKIDKYNAMQGQLETIEDIIQQIKEEKCRLFETNEKYNETHPLYALIMDVREKKEKIKRTEEWLNGADGRVQRFNDNIKRLHIEIEEGENELLEKYDQVKALDNTIKELKRNIDAKQEVILKISNSFDETPISPYPKCLSNADTVDTKISRLERNIDADESLLNSSLLNMFE